MFQTTNQLCCFHWISRRKNLNSNRLEREIAFFITWPMSDGTCRKQDVCRQRLTPPSCLRFFALWPHAHVYVHLAWELHWCFSHLHTIPVDFLDDGAQSLFGPNNRPKFFTSMSNAFQILKKEWNILGSLRCKEIPQFRELRKLTARTQGKNQKATTIYSN